MKIEQGGLQGIERVRLTKREREVMDGLVAGLLYKEIARGLQINYSAVNKHQHRIYQKLHAGNRTEAINRWRDSCRSGAAPEALAHSLSPSPQSV